MKLLDSAVDKLSRSPLLRTLGSRYGRSYWRIPRELRKHLRWERNAGAASGAQTFIVGTPEAIEDIQDKLPLEPRNLGMRVNSQGCTLAAPRVTVIDRAWVAGKYASPVTMRGQLILSAFRDETRIFGLDQHQDLADWLGRKGWKNRDPGDALEHMWSMVNRLQTNYFHWLIDWCGRMQSIERYAAMVGERPTLLVPAKAPAFVPESLALLGFSREQCHVWPEDAPPRIVRRLVLPSLQVGIGTSATPAVVLRWLRNRLLTATGSMELKPTRRIYIPRAPGGWRSVVNDAEVCEWCRLEGIEIVQPHLLPLAEQIRMFASASLIIGLHGAALTNIIFAPHAGLLELFGSYGDGAYFGLAVRLNQPYRPLLCRSVGDDIVVDLSALKRVVQEMEGRGAAAWSSAEANK